MSDRKIVDSFTGKYGYLSNFYPCTVCVDGWGFRSGEHAYQALKADNLAERQLVADCETPGLAKRRGRKVTLRAGWDDLRLEVMEQVLRAKFTRNHDLHDKLVATGDAELIEGNYWKDTFWGVCDGVGENHLGKLLMKIRTELQIDN